MSEDDLPTIEQMFANAITCLDRAYRELGDAADWLRSDWQPADATLTEQQARARTHMFTVITEAKAGINTAKNVATPSVSKTAANP